MNKSLLYRATLAILLLCLSLAESLSQSRSNEKCPHPCEEWDSDLEECVDNIPEAKIQGFKYLGIDMTDPRCEPVGSDTVSASMDPPVDVGFVWSLEAPHAKFESDPGSDPQATIVELCSPSTSYEEEVVKVSTECGGEEAQTEFTVVRVDLQMQCPEEYEETSGGMCPTE